MPLNGSISLCQAGSLSLAGPSEYLASNFGVSNQSPVDPQKIWKKDVPDSSVAQIQEYGGSIAMHCTVNTELALNTGTRGQLPILYIEAPTSGLWEARVSVRVDAEASAGFTLLDKDNQMPDLLFGLDKFASRAFGTSGGVVSLSYSTAGLSGIIASQDLGSLGSLPGWLALKLVRTGSGRYDLFYSSGLGSDAWLAPDGGNSDAGVRQRVFVKNSGAPGARLFSETEWIPLAQLTSTMNRRIGLYLMTGSSGSAKFKDFRVRDLFPQSAAYFSLDNGELRESLDSSGVPVTSAGISSVSSRDGDSQGALLFQDGTGLELPNDPLQRDVSNISNFSLGEFTISLWIKPYSLSAGGILGRRLALPNQVSSPLSPEISVSNQANQGGIQWSMVDESGQNFSEIFETPTQRPYRAVLPTSGSTSLAKVLEVDEWLHIAFVKEADTLMFYRNGKRWGFASLAPSEPTNATGLFLLNYVQGIPYYGAVDDLRFYDVGLAEFAIGHLFSNADVDTLRGNTQRCIAGNSCDVALTGLGLSVQNKYAILAHCGRSNFLTGVPTLGISDATDQISWGNSLSIPLTAAGGKYEICWCGGVICQTPSDFRVLVGSLVVVGPYNQERTCTLGQIASFEIQGLELDSGDKIQILDTCGIDFYSQQRNLSGLPGSATSDLEISSCYGHIGLGVVNTGVEYAHGSGLRGKSESECCLLCQRSLYNDCIAWMHRPSDQTCFLYRTLQTVERQEDRVLGFSRENVANPILLATSLTGNRPGAASVGPFRLYVCRTPLDCSFGTPLVLSNLDSAGYQSFQTAATWPAAWDWNAIKIFSDTSDRWFLESLVVTANGISWNFTYSGWLESGSEILLLREISTQIFFGSSWHAETPSKAPGGRYRLCWCRSSMSNCSSDFDFTADAGQLTLRGPSLSQHMTCITGKPCTLTGLIGHGLSDGDKIMVLDTCGQSGLEVSGMIWDGVSISHYSLVPRFGCQSPVCLREIPCSQYGEIPSLACGISDPAINSGADYTWGGTGGTGGTSIVSAAGGLYKMCWCAAGQTCSMFEHFKVELGELSLLGPSSTEQHRTCVAGQPCVVSNILGALQTGDKIMILDECGKVAEKPMCPHPHSTYTSLNHTLNTQNTQNTFHVESFETGCGSVSDRWPGSSGSSRGISEPAISSAHPCGASMAWTAFHGRFEENFCFAVFDAKSWANAEADCDAIYGGHLASLTQDEVDFLVQWIVEASETYWIGLNDQSNEGTFVNSDGTSSTFFNWGVLQPQTPSASNIEDCVYISSDGFFYDDACSTSRKYICKRAGAFTGSSPGDEFRFGGYRTARESLIAPSSAGGQYRMCWCGGGGAGCQQADDFRMDFGSLTLIGPTPLNQHKTCVAGQPCTLGLLGEDLQNNDLLHILETCGTYVNASQLSHFASSDSALHLPRFPSNNGVQSLSAGATASGTSISFGTTTITAMGGRYRLCWCAAGYSCSAAPDFRVDFGRSLADLGSITSKKNDIVQGQNHIQTI